MTINEAKLNTIRSFLIDNIYENTDIMFNDVVRGDNEEAVDLIAIITDLYEYLHILINGESYDYMFHWANKIGAYADTGRFDRLIELIGEQNE